MKTYILKYDVCNFKTFPMGTIVKITDDYWGKSGNDKNTGFTVVEGEMKDQKGCVVDGLEGKLLEDTIQNRNSVKYYKLKEKKINRVIKQLNDEMNNFQDSLPAAKIN